MTRRRVLPASVRLPFIADVGEETTQLRMAWVRWLSVFAAITAAAAVIDGSKRRRARTALERQQAVDFIKKWISTELLVRTPSGDSKQQILSRFLVESLDAGLSVEEVERALDEEGPSLQQIVEKHRTI